MTATIHYLQWHDDDENAKLKFHNLHGEDVSVNEEEFKDLWDEVGEDSDSDLNDVFARWNRGSGREADIFLKQEIRSLSVGDIVEVDGTKHLCSSIGWTKLEF